ncbi:MAG: type II CAAX endopeptidase family protein [Cyclobacteriaceae bacterium]
MKSFSKRTILITKTLLAILVVSGIKFFFAQTFPELYTNELGVVLVDMIAYVPALLLFFAGWIQVYNMDFKVNSDFLFVPFYALLYFMLLIAVKAIVVHSKGYDVLQFIGTLKTLSSRLKTQYLSFLISGPILEELFYRGLVLAEFRKKFNANWAILLSSILFAIAHVDVGYSFIDFISIFVLGLIFSYYVTRLKNILWCIYFHLCFNSMNYIFSYFLNDFL